MKYASKKLAQIFVVAVAVGSQVLASEPKAKAGRKIPTPSQWVPFAQTMHNAALMMSHLTAQCPHAVTFEDLYNIMERDLQLVALQKTYDDAEKSYYKLLSDINS